MAANVQPKFINVPNVNFAAVTAANTSSEGGGTIGTNMFLAFTAGANGSFVESVVWMPTASTAATSTTATVGRIFICEITSGSPTSSNTMLISEEVLPSVTADSSSTANQPIEIPVNRWLNANWGILVTNHAAPAANSQWIATVYGGDF